MSRIIFLVMAFIPLSLHSPYLMQAWKSSRLDHYDWIFFLLFLPAAFWAVRGEKTYKYDFYALFLLVPALLPAVMTSLHHINALGVAASFCVIFAVVWLLYSWKIAYRIFPAAVILLLGTPSSSYLLSLLLMCPVFLAWTVKILLAVLCFFWIWCNRHFDLRMNRGSFFFSAAVFCSCLLLLHTREIYFEGRSFIPEFSGRIGEYWGRKIQPDENTKRFFATSMVQQFRYTGSNTDISVLAVKCGNDIHEIHPASHCLRTGMWTVLSEEILYLHSNFAVTEIDAKKGNYRILVWVWYSSPQFSTPGFLGFRRHFQVGKQYYTYQISIPVSKDAEQSRTQLWNFVQLLKKEKKK